jgi:hypothetical protein
MKPKIESPLSVPERRDPRIAEELIRRASDGCEGPLDDGCWQSRLPMHLWCDPCRCQEAAKEIKLLAALLAAPSPAPQGWQAVVEAARPFAAYLNCCEPLKPSEGVRVEAGRLAADCAALLKAIEAVSSAPADPPRPAASTPGSE